MHDDQASRSLPQFAIGRYLTEGEKIPKDGTTSPVAALLFQSLHQQKGRAVIATRPFCSLLKGSPKCPLSVNLSYHAGKVALSGFCQGDVVGATWLARRRLRHRLRRRSGHRRSALRAKVVPLSVAQVGRVSSSRLACLSMRRRLMCRGKHCRSGLRSKVVPLPIRYISAGGCW